MPLQATGTCNFNEFTDLMHHLLKAAWGDDWGTFSETFSPGIDPESVVLPAITYSIVSRVPAVMGERTREIKPRLRGTFYPEEDVNGESVAINVYSQSFDYQINFELYEENNTKVSELCERFEDFMVTYTGYMMHQGVQQIIFLQMLTPEAPSLPRDRTSCRSYRYLVRLERQVAIPTDVVKEVIARVEIARNLNNDQDLSIEAIELKLNKGGTS